MRSGANEGGEEGKDSESRKRETIQGKRKEVKTLNRRGGQLGRSEKEGVRPRQRVGGAAGLSAINSSTL